MKRIDLSADSALLGAALASVVLRGLSWYATPGECQRRPVQVVVQMPEVSYATSKLIWARRLVLDRAALPSASASSSRRKRSEGAGHFLGGSVEAILA